MVGGGGGGSLRIVILIAPVPLGPSRARLSARRRAPRLAWAEVDSEPGAVSLLAPCSTAAGSTGPACLRHVT